MQRFAIELVLFTVLISALVPASSGPEEIHSKEIPPATFVETVISPPQQVIEQANTEGSPLESIPKRIVIPGTPIDAEIEQVGVLANGAMDVPKDDRKVGWLYSGYTPGENGNAVMAGHVDNLRGVAVFHPLHQMKVGDEVLIKRSDQKTLTFVVIDKQVYRTEKAPIQKIFGFADTPKLNLITCTGYFDPKRRTHIDRLVIYTELKP
jgi:LPXTG-site transpeptidase (sortase) family protein